MGWLAWMIQRDFKTDLTARLTSRSPDGWSYDEISDGLGACGLGSPVDPSPLITDRGIWALLRSLNMVTAKQFVSTCLYMTAATVLSSLEPYFLELVMKAFGQLQEQRSSALLELAIVCLLIPGMSFVEQIFFRRYLDAFRAAHAIQRWTVMGRIFSHWLRIRPDTRSGLSHGDVQNHMAIDGPAICHGAERVADAGMTLFQIVIASALLIRYFQSTAIVSIALVFCLTPITSFLVKEYRKRQGFVLERQDARISLMGQIFSAIRVIKLSGWEAVFSRRAQELRDQEVKGLLGVAKLDSFSNLIYSSNGLVIATVTYGIHLWRGGSLSPEMLFPTLLIFNNLSMPFEVLKDVIRVLSQMQVSAGRIVKFLQLPEESSTEAALPVLDDKGGIRISNFTFHTPDGRLLLDRINVSIPKGTSLAIVGPVGCGKTTILRAILGELGPDVDRFIARPRAAVAYCPQEPFVASGTLASNITFFSEQRANVREAISSAFLDGDISRWHSADQTEIGERGINLSGGQKQRITLARAAYFDRDLIVLDDPLAAVDVVAENWISSKLIFRKWLGKTVICATHRLAHLADFDQILFIDKFGRGHTGSLGTLSEGIPEFRDFVDRESHGAGARDAVAKSLSGANDGVEKESTLVGTELTSTYETTGNLWRRVSKLLARAASERHPLLGGVVLVGIIGLASLLPLFQQFWMSLAQSRNPNYNVLSKWAADGHSFYLVYAALTVVVIAVKFLGQYFFRVCNIKAATNTHDGMLRGVMASPIRFFDVTPLGRILNRFSADLMQADQEFADKTYRLMTSAMATAGQFFMVIVEFPFAAIPLLAGLWNGLRLGRYYAPASNDIRRLAAAARSPVYGMFSEAVRGWATIRAYRAEFGWEAQFDSKLRRSINCELENANISMWLMMRMNLANSMILCMVLGGICTREIWATSATISPAAVGLVITYLMSMLNRQDRIFRDAVAVGNALVPWDRCIQWAELPTEEEAVALTSGLRPSVEVEPFLGGTIEFDQVEARYGEHLPAVLSSASFSIAHGEHVGVAGRSGSGKSTLFLSLLRAIPVTKGDIRIGGRSIFSLPLPELRNSIAYVPQEPQLFLGPLRDSIDIFGKFTDPEIVTVLNQVGLGPMLSGLPLGLQTELEENGKNLSAGERQLVCLARALLLKTRIVLLDEATASVDPETDFKIHQAVKRDFADATVLLIAHRPSSLQGCKKVIYVESGMAVVRS